MNKHLLGTTGLEVSPAFLGCMGFGDSSTGQHAWTLGYEDTRAIVAHALAKGVNAFDTAVVYQNGSSERFLGRALAELARRDEVVVATKFPVRSDVEQAEGVSGQEHVRHCLDQSLENLGMDHVDLYICHMWDYHTPIEETLEGMNEAVESGKARALGISNCFAWQIAKANAIAEKNGWHRIKTIQGHYNLIFREEEREMAPYCAEEGIAMTPYSSLAGGRLARRPGETSRRLELDSYAHSKYDAMADADAPIIARVAELADRHECSMTAVSLAWLFAKGCTPVVGATKERHVDGIVEAASLRLLADEIAYLEEPYVPHALVGVMAQNRAGAKTFNPEHPQTNS